MQKDIKLLCLMVVFTLLTSFFGTTAAYLLYDVSYNTVFITGSIWSELALGAAATWAFFECLGRSLKYWYRLITLE